MRKSLLFLSFFIATSSSLALSSEESSGCKRKGYIFREGQKVKRGRIRACISCQSYKRACRKSKQEQQKCDNCLKLINALINPSMRPCVLCFKKKVKCIRTNSSASCEYCSTRNEECLPNTKQNEPIPYKEAN